MIDNQGSRSKLFPVFISIVLFVFLTSMLFIMLQSGAVKAETSGVGSVTFTKTDTIINDVLGNGQANPGDTMRYDLTINNTTVADLTNVVLTDVIDPNLMWSGVWQSTALALSDAFTTTENTAVPITMTGNDPDGDTLTFSILTPPSNGSLGAIMPQTAVSANVLYTPNMGFSGSDSFTFQVEDDDGNTDSATINITVINSDIAVTKEVAAPTPFAGSRITYTVAAGNQGGIALTNIVISDVLPANLTYFGHSTSAGSYNSGTGSWSIANIGVGITHTLSIYLDINAGTAGQTITNTAEFVSMDQIDANPANNSQSAIFTVQPQVDIAITKTVDDNAPLEGDTIVYTVSATNNGPDDATGVQVTDVLPSGVTYVSDDQASYTPPLWNIGNLNATQSATLNITTTINSMTAGNIYTNTATVTAVNETDSNPSNDSDQATITVNLAPTAVDDEPGGLFAYQVSAGTTMTIPNGSFDPVERNDIVGFPVATITSFGGGDIGGTVTDNAAGATVTPISGYTNGSLTVNADGSFVFTSPTSPTAFSGNFQFEYRLTNANGTSDATVTIQVQAGPTAVNDPNGGFPANSTPPGGANPHPYHFAVNSTNNVISGVNRLLQNDNLAAPPASLVSFGGGSIPGTDVTTIPAGGGVTAPSGLFLSVDASGWFTYTPPTDFVGLFTFEYRLQNAIGFDDATVTLASGNRPLCSNDAYNSTGNVGINVPAGGVLLNDTGDGIAITAVQGSAANIGNPTATSVTGGSVTLNADGSFSYMPPAGYVGNDTFTYDLDNNFNAPSTCTVTVTVSDMIWFIDNAAPGGGNGRLNTPFNTLAAFNAINTGPPPNAQTGNTVFMHTGAGNYTGGLTLRNDQILIGQGASASITAITGITLPPNSNTLPATGGTNPVITNGAGSGLTLGTGNTVRGVNVDGTSGAGIWGPGANNTTISETAVTNAGGAAVYFQSAAITTTFTALSSNGSQGDGILLNAVSGTFDVSGNTTIINSATEGIEVVNSGSLVADFGNTTITNAGTDGIDLSNSAGANFTFDSLSITTDGTGGVGFLANNAGTVTITGSANTITVNNETAVNINNTTFGASGVTFRSISANGGSNGIIIQNTTGNFTIAGTGAAASGGTIQNMNGANGTTNGIGIYLNNTQNINLNDMQLNDFQNFAIYGNNVTNFTFADSVISGNNGDSAADDEGSISFDNLLGTATFNTSSISGAFEDNINVLNTNGTLNMNVSGSTIGLNHVNFGNDGILVESQNNAILNLNVTGSNFLGARGDMIQCNALGTSNMDCIIRDNTFNNTHTNSLGGGITISGGSATSNINLTYDVSGSSQGSQTFRGSVASAITANIVNGNGIAHGFIRNNDIGVSGVANSGSSTGSGISVGTAVDVEHRVLIDNNDIVRVGGSTGMIDLISNVSASPSDGLYATVTNNNIDEASGFIFAGIYTMSGGSHSGGTPDSSHMCLDMRNNTINVLATGGLDYFIDKIGGSPATYYFPGFGGASGGAALDAFLAGQNTLNSGGGDSSSATTLSGSGTQCAQPTPPGPPPPRPAEDGAATATKVFAKFSRMQGPTDVNGGPALIQSLGTIPAGKSMTISFEATINDPFPDMVSEVSNQGQITADGAINILSDDPDTPTPDDPTITPVVIIPSFDFTKQDVLLVDADGNNVASPGDTIQYTVNFINTGNNAINNIVFTDTVDVNSTLDNGSITTSSGPAHTSNRVVNPQGGAPGFSIIWVPPLPAGEGITITFNVDVNDPFPTDISQISNQAFVTADNITSTPSDDPDTPATMDPTITPVDATQFIYLPVVLNNYASLPDLVVQSITPSTNDVTVVIQNNGNAPVTDAFWVDAYFNPPTPPTAVNQTINTMNIEGIVWGVTSSALPIEPGESLTLTIGSPYYNAVMSNFNGTIPSGTLYVQVDSANIATTYGAVLETHEATGGAYNNISSTTVSRPVSFLGETNAGRSIRKLLMPKRP